MRLCTGETKGYFSEPGYAGNNGSDAMSMQGVASPAVTLTPPKRTSLKHIPGDEGWPVIGRTLAILADPKGEVEQMAAKYGLVYRSRVLGETSISVLGPEANELVLFDQSKLFSSTHGWGTILGRLFPRGLMLLDFDEHRLHRRALSVAFKSGPMKSYLAALDAGISERVTRWRQLPGPMLFYPAMKQLTLDLAATSFLGEGIGPEVDEITRAFVDMVAAAVAPIRTLAGHANGAWRQGPRTHRRLFLGADSNPSHQRRRGSFLAVMPGDARRRRAVVDAGYRRSHEFSDDGCARHADIVTDVVRGSARGQPEMAAKAA
jgi:Cytochrome P450